MLIGVVLTGTVIHVVDGDTFDLAVEGGTVERIRLADIDAPDRPSEARQESGNVLRGWVGGNYLVCVSKGASWGRVVATCRMGGVDVGAWMVRHGQAVPDCRFDGYLYNADALNEEDQCLEAP